MESFQVELLKNVIEIVFAKPPDSTVPFKINVSKVMLNICLDGKKSTPKTEGTKFPLIQPNSANPARE